MGSELLLFDDRWRRWWIVGLAAMLVLINVPRYSFDGISLSSPINQSASSENLPAGLEAAIATTLGETYLITSGAADSLGARNPRQDLEANFSIDGFEVEAMNSEWSFGLSLDRFGRQGQLIGVAGSSPVAAGSRVEYQRPAFTEWYENRPEGIEHGITLFSPPPGQGMVEFAFDRSGTLSAELAPDGRTVSLADSHSKKVLSYQDLVVYDASGTKLPARMELGLGSLSLLIDDSEANYPITVDPLVVTEEARLFASDAAAGDRFGADVALSGNTALVAGDGLEDTAVYVFVHSGTAWTEQARLAPSDGSGGDHFGISVALAGDTAVVGASTDDTANGEDTGSAYVFVREGTTWTEQAHLVASDGRPNDFFGTSVAASGDSILVGAFGDDARGTEVAGSAYVFVRNGTTWTEQAHIFAAVPTASDQFGASVALEGDTALIGNPGADSEFVADVGSVDVFTRSGTTWTQQARLFGSEGQAGADLGLDIDLDGNTALVGAAGTATVAGENVGSVYIFVRNGTIWTEQAHLFASDGAAVDFFGGWVGLSGDTAVVTAIGDDTTAGVNAGSAYVFVRDGNTWTEQARIFALDGVSGDFFGTSVALEGDIAVIGAVSDDTAAGVDAGSVYVYQLSAGSTCSITGTEGNDVLVGTSGDDVICGLGGNDRLGGRGGNDTLLGGEGNDTLDGGPGTNTLEGQGGNDTASYARSSSGVTADLVAGLAIGSSTDTLVSIENLVGSNSGDRLAGDSGDNLLQGGAGTDRLNGRGGIDTCLNGESVTSCEL